MDYHISRSLFWAIVFAVSFGSYAITLLATMNAYKKQLEKVKRQAEMLKQLNDDLMENDAALQKELVSANQDLNTRVICLVGLIDMVRELVVIGGLEEVLEKTVNLAMELIDAEAGMLRILDEETGELVLAYQAGFTQEYVAQNRRVGLDGPVGQVLRELRTLIGAEVKGRPAGMNTKPKVGETQDRSVYFLFSVPLAVSGKAIGILSLYTAKVHSHSEDEAHMLNLLAAYAAIAVENARLYSGLKEANQELSFLRDYNANIMESIPNGIVVLNRDLRITMWNSGMEMVLGIERSEALGKRYSQVLRNPEEMDFEKLIELVVRTGEVRQIRNLNTALKSDERLVSRRLISPLRAREGEILGAIVVVEDVTEKVRLGEQLKRAERLSVIGEFAAGIAHEINNPMGIISASADLLAERVKRISSSDGQLTDGLAGPLRIIEEEAARCSSIIKNLLAFSRHPRMNWALTDVRKVVDETVVLVGAGARQQNVSIEVRHSDELPLVRGDEHQLKQVFLNLMLNAIQAMSGGGRLSIVTRLVSRPHTPTGNGGNEPSRERVEAMFIDTGCGIPQESLDKIFDPFYTTKPTGTGLGLPVSHSIIVRHGGSLSVTSEVGKGSVFAVELSVDGSQEMDDPDDQVNSEQFGAKFSSR